MKRALIRGRFVALGLSAALLFSGVAGAKTVVIIDVKLDAMGNPTEDGYLSNMEGYTLGQIDQSMGDLVFRGGNFTTALAQVADGDTVVIIVHGLTGSGGKGFGFTWGGMQYTGFGTGGQMMPVPADFNQRRNVTIEFRACYSANDPDGSTGTDVSLNDKILHAMGDHSSNTANGFKGLAQAPADFSFPFPPGFPSNLEASYRSQVYLCLADPAWKDLPPKNRSTPPPDPNQESKALELIQTCWEMLPASHLLSGYPPPSQILLEYGTPRSVGNESAGSGSRGWFETCGEAVYTVDGAMFLDCFEFGDTSGWSGESP